MFGRLRFLPLEHTPADLALFLKKKLYGTKEWQLVLSYS